MNASDPPRKVLRILIGSRSFVGSCAEPWARGQVTDYLTPTRPETVVMSGGARGPDVWARETSLALPRRIVEYRLDGLRWCDGKPAGGQHRRWTEDPPPGPGASAEEWKRWCLARDIALAKKAIEARDDGWDVEALALRAPWSQTQGTAFTSEVLRAGNIAVLSPSCPRELWPDNAPT